MTYHVLTTVNTKHVIFITQILCPTIFDPATLCHRCWQRANNVTRQSRIGNADNDIPGPEIQRNADDVNVQNVVVEDHHGVDEQDQELHFWTGLTLEKFDAILAETPSLSERARNPRTILGVYVTKLRSGEPNERLATLFKTSRRELERKLKIARECFTPDFVPNHLGIGHVSRRDLLQRNLMIPKAIYGNKENTILILIADGTYIYIEKSSNFLF
ncbi:unnamed protein product [Euphydryas editha]|uniref:Uncharacterized protein n=1 Tax=Euphydryas editha TaxID=104508 RepID=A0AAU9U4H9_EUPED|nr:unnamed protein product [Euphydryas editha]